MNAKTQTKEKPQAAAPAPAAAPATGEVPGTEQLPTTTQANAVALADDDFSGFGGQGLENLGKDDLAIPFLTILQANSPQCKRSDGQYIDGAAEGMLFNTVTKEVIDPVKEKVLLIPAYYDRNFVEWKVREAGGGFVAQHDVPKGLSLQADSMRDDKNRDILPNGHQINDTRTFFCIMIREDAEGGRTTCPVFITMTSTQIKKAKQWLMQQNLLKLRRADKTLYTPPMFASLWRVSTVPESNERGSWMGWAFTHEGYLKGTSDALFIEAQKFHESIKAGAVKVDLSKAGGDEEPGERRSGGGQRQANGNPDDMDDDIPF